MTRWPDDRDRIDSAIDAVARKMTEALLAADFRTRVLSRISETRPVWRSPWALSPAAIAAVVLLAVVLYHRRPANPDTRSPQTHAESGRPDSGLASTARQPINPDGLIPSESPQSAQSRSTNQSPFLFAPGRAGADSSGSLPTTRSARTAEAMFASGVDELAPPPLDVTAIAVDRLAHPEPITLQHLEIPSIALTPLAEGDRQ